MQIDAFTVLLSGIFIKALLGVLFFLFWAYERRSTWFGWWSATYFLAMLGALIFLLRGFDARLSAIGVGVAALIAAFGCCWQGARAFGHRRSLWIPLALAPLLWLAICLVPGFLENLRARVVVSSILLAPLIAMSAVELWRGRSERLLSRWPAIVLFGTLALLFASRIPFVDLLPFPFGALPVQPSWVAAFHLMILFHTLVLTVLLVALSKERLELHERTMAQTDFLTGALNRRALMLRGGRLLQRHAHEKAPLCLVFLDIDHFKSLNDRFGHFGGDQALRQFVELVQETIRPTDFLFRMGGEEFCCLLPYTGAEHARLVAERIRARFENTPIGVPGSMTRTTVSAGIASTEDVGYDIETLIRRADMAVYEAKRRGRNCVVVAAAESDALSSGPAPPNVASRAGGV